MLKQQFKNQFVDVRDYVLGYSQSIKARREKDLILQIIFDNIPKVKIVAFDYNWGILNEFDVVCDAIVKLSSIVIDLGLVCFTDPYCVLIKNHMYMLYNTLKKGLIAYGCRNRGGECDVSPAALILIAEQVVDL